MVELVAALPASGDQTRVLEAEAPRVRCPEHGVVVAAVPWARHNAGHTRAFDDQVAWLAVQCSKTAVTELMRIAWRTVGAVVTLLVAGPVAQVVLRALGVPNHWPSRPQRS